MHTNPIKGFTYFISGRQAGWPPTDIKLRIGAKFLTEEKLHKNNGFGGSLIGPGMLVTSKTYLSGHGCVV